MKYKRFLNKQTILLFLLFISVFLLFWNIWKKPVEIWDEGTNAEVVYESLHSENPLNLKLFGRPFFEKPPLWYFLTEMSVATFGYNEFGIRFVSAFAGLGILIITLLIGKKVSFGTGIFSVVTLQASRILFLGGTSNLFATHTLSSADLDSLHLFFLVGSFYFFINYFEKYKAKFFYLGSLFSALSFLSKGPFALLPILIVLLFIFINRKKKPLDLKTLAIGILVFFIFLLPWHIYEFINFKSEFVNSYFAYHLISRAGSSIEGHSENPLFYINLLTKPEVFFSVVTLIAGFLLITKKKITNSFHTFAISLGFLFPFVLLSFIQTKLSWYIFYCIPFAAVVNGFFLEHLWQTKKQFVSLIIFISTFAVLSVLILTNIYSTLIVQSSSFNQAAELSEGKTLTFINNELPNRSELFYLRKLNINYLILDEEGLCNTLKISIDEKGCNMLINSCLTSSPLPLSNCSLDKTEQILIEKENMNLTLKFSPKEVIKLNNDFILLK